MGNKRMCELCSGEAVAYCVADSAFLCLTCDAKVHGANFLVARHGRQIVCSNCEEFTGDHISGLGSQGKALICRFCSSTELDSGELDSLSSSSSSSACVSGAKTSFRASPFKKIPAVNGGQRGILDSKTMGILVHWCKRFGLSNDVAAVVIRMACNGLGVCAGKLTSLPFRVCLVAALWFGLRSSGIKSLLAPHGLTRLQKITRVSAKLISGTELKIELLYRSTKQKQNSLPGQHDQLLKEDWAESSGVN